MKKEEFLKGFDDPENQSVLVRIKLPFCPELETIINPKSNFAVKKDYYNTMYDDDLCMKSLPTLRIVEYEFYK